MPFSDHRPDFTPEAIRQRMAQHMVQLWGVKSLNSIDPFARLLMETLASELHLISHEFLQAEAGLLERLASLLTPSQLAGPRPAHAVVWAQPTEPVAYMAPTDSLLATRRVASKPYGELDTRQDIFLSAIDTVKLLSGRVSWLAAGTELHRPAPDGTKQLAHRTAGTARLPAHTLWLGLAMHPGVTSLDRLGLYVELPHVSEPSRLLELLPLARWELNGQPLDVRPGLCYDPDPSAEPRPTQQAGQLLNRTTPDEQLEQDIKQLYGAHFLHIRQLAPIDVAAWHTAPPAEVAACFTDPALEELAATPLLWLKVVLPASFSEEILSHLHVRLNAVPVLNRRLHRLTHRPRVLPNLVPLPVAPREAFLAVHSLLDSHHRIFSPYPLRTAEQPGPGHYTVRRGGTERFDARNAREQLHHLLEVLRDEAVAFAAYGYDTVQLEARQQAQHLANLERLLGQQDAAIRELPHYILLTPYEEYDTLEVSYWTTAAEEANNLPAGTELQAYDMTYLAGSQPVLLTVTVGGQHRRDATGQLDAYRYALLSHERLVTNEDIRAFVRAELGELLRDVTLRPGVMVSPLPKQGFVRTLDIELVPAPAAQLTAAEWLAFCDSLRAKLLSRSAQNSQYRVAVKYA